MANAIFFYLFTFIVFPHFGYIRNATNSSAISEHSFYEVNNNKRKMINTFYRQIKIARGKGCFSSLQTVRFWYFWVELFQCSFLPSAKFFVLFSTLHFSLALFFVILFRTILVENRLEPVFLLAFTFYALFRLFTLFAISFSFSKEVLGAS